MSAPAVGYWTQTASENWCEADYTHSFYVAEWWNTLSSFPLVIFSLLALRLGLLHGYPKRLLLPSLLTALVGLGSVWFHGTLSYGGQALDELSMVVAATAFLYVGLEADPRAIKLPWLAPALAAWSASFIGAYVYLKDTSYFLFFVVIFALLSTRCCYTAYLLHQRTADPTLRTLFFCGQSLWAAGFLLFWLPDKLFCSTFQPFNLHAIFHLMTAQATFWFHTHNVHCWYTALYACRTGGMAPLGSGSSAPASPALLDFLQLHVAPEGGDARAPPGAAAVPTAKAPAPARAPQPPLQRPYLKYYGGLVGPFCALEAEKSHSF